MSIPSIPLRRLSSKSGSTSVPSKIVNPFETASIISTTASTISQSSDYTITAASSQNFIPTSKLQVQTPGHGFWQWPFVIHDRETVIFTLDSNNKVERPKWVSIRREKGMGNFWISDAEDESQTAVARGMFKWGPAKDPRMRIGHNVERDGKVMGLEGIEEAEIKTRWMTRTCAFAWRGRMWQWRYGDKAERRVVSEAIGEGCDDLLLLEETDNEEKGKVRGKAVARFIRGAESRTPGTKRSHGGNGGRLEMALDDQDEGGITDIVVVTSLLVMLKREVDRVRAGSACATFNSKGLALIGYGIAYAARPNAAWPQEGPFYYQKAGTDYLGGRKAQNRTHSS